MIMGLKQTSGVPFFVGLVTGGLVGAGLGLLLAPQTGEEIRVKLKNKGLELKDQAKERALEASQQAQEQLTVWQEKGKEVFEKGKQNAFEY